MPGTTTKARLAALIYDLAMQGPPEALFLGSRRRKLIAPLRGLVLEIGAGTGLSLRHYSRFARVIATDKDIASLERLKRRGAKAQARAAAVVSDAASLPFPDASFDGLVCNFALCTIADPVTALAEARRVLKPGSPARFLEHVRADQPALARTQDVLAPAWKVALGGCRLNQDTEKIIREAGLRIEKVETKSLLILPLKLVWARVEP